MSVNFCSVVRCDNVYGSIVSNCGSSCIGRITNMQSDFIGLTLMDFNLLLFKIVYIAAIATFVYCLFMRICIWFKLLDESYKCNIFNGKH